MVYTLLFASENVAVLPNLVPLYSKRPLYKVYNRLMNLFLLDGEQLVVIYYHTIERIHFCEPVFPQRIILRPFIYNCVS